MERLAGRVILLWGWRRALLAFAVGALTVLALAPFDFFAVCLISFPVLVWLLDGAEPELLAGRLRRLAPAFSIGWWFGFGYFLAGLWWIGNALLVDAESFAWALPLAVLVMPAGVCAQEREAVLTPPQVFTLDEAYQQQGRTEEAARLRAHAAQLATP